jgi:hypothetical protein
MNKKSLTALILGSLLVLSTNTNAANLATNSKDLFLGFDTTSGTGAYKSVVFDLGTLANIDLIGSTKIDLSSGSSILSTTFGASWWTRSDLTWGVFGGNTATNFILSSATGAGALDLSPNSGGYIDNDTRTQEVLSFSAVNAQHGAGTTGSVSGTVGSFAYGVDAGNGTSFKTGSWGDQFDNDGANGNANGAFNNSTGPLGVAFYDGSSYTGLDVYNFVKANNLNWYSLANPSVTVGLDATGAITIASTAVAVPEPSTYALLGFGALLMVVAYRRSQQSAS